MLTSIASAPVSVAVGGQTMLSEVFWRLAVERALKVTLLLGAALTAVYLLWPTKHLGWEGTLAVAGAVAGIVFVVELIAGFHLQSGRLAAHQELVQAAERAVPHADGPDDEQEADRVGAPVVSLDARLAVRYRRARVEAEAEVRRYLPTNPRTAKRMVNHVSLAMAIAAERGVFRDSAITQQHLSKWIGLAEQWPALGAALTTAPARITDLEKAATLAELQTVLDTIARGTVASEELRRRLRDGVPLGGVLERLVRFEPS